MELLILLHPLYPSVSPQVLSCASDHLPNPPLLSIPASRSLQQPLPRWSRCSQPCFFQAILLSSVTFSLTQELPRFHHFVTPCQGQPPPFLTGLFLLGLAHALRPSHLVRPGALIAISTLHLPDFSRLGLDASFSRKPILKPPRLGEEPLGVSELPAVMLSHLLLTLTGLHPPVPVPALSSMRVGIIVAFLMSCCLPGPRTVCT